MNKRAKNKSKRKSSDVKKSRMKSSKTDQVNLQEVRLKSESVFQGHFLQVFRDQVRLPDGTETSREYIKHPGAAMVIPVLGEDVLLVRQYRYSLGQEFLEFPAGKIDAGESSLETAHRELLEETGLRARKMKFIQRIHPVIGYSNEFIDLYLATGITRTERQLDHGEFVEPVEISIKKLNAMVKQGKITDVKTLIGIFWLNQLRR